MINLKRNIPKQQKRTENHWRNLKYAHFSRATHRYKYKGSLSVRLYSVKMRACVTGHDLDRNYGCQPGWFENKIVFCSLQWPSLGKASQTHLFTFILDLWCWFTAETFSSPGDADPKSCCGANRIIMSPLVWAAGALRWMCGFVRDFYKFFLYY